jgi:serine/threonine protein kinase
LSHISPEQTGRLDRVVDYRTDFYSLGVTIYQLLSGKKPFISDDVMELIHSHVAVEPPPLPRHIPTVLCEIVAKLMSKDADDRYVSITGLLHDLNMCQTNLTNGCIEYFPIATHDFMAKFVIPKKLYGREEESKTLLETFERVSTRGKGELLLVSGYSGIGKSSLIAQIRTPITMRNGYYITGKFDQVSKNISYSAIADAFQSLLRQILGESEERVQMWRERILKSVGLNGSLIIKMIPEVEKLIGEQPPVSMNPQESASRFKLVLQSFVSTFMQKDHPLVLFLDDLQCKLCND